MGGGGGGGVQVQSHTQKVPRRQTLCTACPVTSYRARSVLADSLVRSRDSRCTASASRRIAASSVGRDAVETLRRTASSLGITGNTGSPRLSHHHPPPPSPRLLCCCFPQLISSEARLHRSASPPTQVALSGLVLRSSVARKKKKGENFDASPHKRDFIGLAPLWL